MCHLRAQAVGSLTPRCPTVRPRPGHPPCLRGTGALVVVPTGRPSPTQTKHPVGFWSPALHSRAQSKTDIQHPLAGHRYFKKMYFYVLFYTHLEGSHCSQQLALLPLPNGDTWSWGRAQVTATQVLVTVPAATAAHALGVPGEGQGEDRKGQSRSALAHPAEHINSSCLASEVTVSAKEICI